MRIIIPEFDYVLTDNANLNRTWREYEAPITSYTTIVSDGYGAHMLLLLGLYLTLLADHRTKREGNPATPDG